MKTTFRHRASLQALDVVDLGAGPSCRDTSERLRSVQPVVESAASRRRRSAFVSVPSFQDGDTFQYMGQATITGDLGQYGMKSPWAEDGIGIAGGVEWRKDGLDYSPDLFFSVGRSRRPGRHDRRRQAVRSKRPTSSSKSELAARFRHGLRAFAEFRRRLSPFGHFEQAGSFSSWKLAGNWQVTDDIRVRGGWQRAVRAPNVIELFTPAADGPHGLVRRSVRRCSADRNPRAVYRAGRAGGSTTARSSTAPRRSTTQCSPATRVSMPEISDTYTVGVVLTPGDWCPAT